MATGSAARRWVRSGTRPQARAVSPHASDVVSLTVPKDWISTGTVGNGSDRRGRRNAAARRMDMENSSNGNAPAESRGIVR